LAEEGMTANLLSETGKVICLDSTNISAGGSKLGG